MSQRFKKIVLLIGDAAILYAALWLTLLARYQVIPSAERWQQHTDPFTIVFAVWVLVFFIAGLYTLSVRSRGFKFFSLLVQTMLINAGLGAAFFYIAPDLGISPKITFVLVVSFSTLLLIAWRTLAQRLIGLSAFRTHMLLIGTDEELHDVVLEIGRQSQLGYHITETLNPLSAQAANVDLGKLIADNGIRVVAAESETLKDPALIQQLFNALSHKVNVVTLAEFMEEITGKVPVKLINHSWFLEHFKFGSHRTFEFIKKIFDLVSAVILFVVLMPLMILTAFLILVSSGGPVFYTQIRTGYLGKPFKMLKFRTMVTNAEKDGAQWAQKNDSRITPIGKFLRKTRLDELPQLVNVLRGELSFVGPRPERPEFVEKLNEKIPFYNERHLVRPGLSGWAQINYDYGASEEDAMEKLQYDLYYAKNRSVALETAIMLKTLKTILTGAGQ